MVGLGLRAVATEAPDQGAREVEPTTGEGAAGLVEILGDATPVLDGPVGGPLDQRPRTLAAEAIAPANVPATPARPEVGDTERVTVTWRGVAPVVGTPLVRPTAAITACGAAARDAAEPPVPRRRGQGATGLRVLVAATNASVP